MLKKIVILADSLSLPRPKKDIGNIRYEDTYPYLLDISLRKKLGHEAPIVTEKGKRYRTITEVAADWREYVTWRKPEMVVVQVGITDCAPRVFSSTQRSKIERIRPLFLRTILLKLVHRYRRNIIESSRTKVYVPIEEYRETVARLVKLAESDNVRLLVFVKIAVPPAFVENRSPGLQRNVLLYNSVLEQYKDSRGVHIVDLNEVFGTEEYMDEFLLEDGQHYNAEGSRLVAQHLEKLAISVLYEGGS